MFARVQDAAALVGRLGIALVFFMHGLEKLDAGIPATTAGMEAMGIPLPTLSVLFIVAVEIIGSVAFAAGFATPLVGIGYAVVGLGAMFLVHLDAGLTGAGGYETVFVLATAGLAVGFNAGRFSLDHLLLERRRARQESDVEHELQSA